MPWFFHEFCLRIEEMLRNDTPDNTVLHSWEARRILEEKLKAGGFSVLASDSTLGVLPEKYIIGSDEPHMAELKWTFFEHTNKLGMLYRSGETYRQVSQ